MFFRLPVILNTSKLVWFKPATLYNVDVDNDVPYMNIVCQEPALSFTDVLLPLKP